MQKYEHIHQIEKSCMSGDIFRIGYKNSYSFFGKFFLLKSSLINENYKELIEMFWYILPARPRYTSYKRLSQLQLFSRLSQLQLFSFISFDPSMFTQQTLRWLNCLRVCQMLEVKDRPWHVSDPTHWKKKYVYPPEHLETWWKAFVWNLSTVGQGSSRHLKFGHFLLYISMKCTWIMVIFLKCGAKSLKSNVWPIDNTLAVAVLFWYLLYNCMEIIILQVLFIVM